VCAQSSWDALKQRRDTTLTRACRWAQQVEVLEYPELGMEAVWRIEVEDFPAFVIVDDKGEDFFKNLSH
jgi:tartrate dehydratase beta subunit/fumarate hydratase class I family protein